MGAPPPDHDGKAEAIAAWNRLLKETDSPDPNAFLARFPPEIAGDIAPIISDMLYLHLQGKPPDDAVPPSMLPIDAASTEIIGASPLVPVDFTRLKIHGFQILDQIGHGRQGIVLRARQRGAKRIVAVKVMRDGALASPDMRRRFENEIEVASRLNHPNIVTVHHSGEVDGHAYFVMQFIDGRPLNQYCDAQNLDVRGIVKLMAKVCRAIGYAHQKAVLHRDLKPTNILVDEAGEPHVVDFGLAKGVDEPGMAVSQQGDFAGTLFYASPEQVKLDPAALDVRSDVYSLGIILYQLVTGAWPYDLLNKPMPEVARIILEAPPRPPTQIVRDLDRDLETVLLRALDKEPDRRYPTGGALADDLDRYLAGEPIEARRDDTIYVLRRLVRKHRAKVAAAAAAVLGIVAFAVIASVLYLRAEAEKATAQLRLNLHLDSFPYVVEELQRMQSGVNALHEIVLANPNLPAVQRFMKPASSDAIHLLDQLVCNVPEQIVSIMLGEDDEDRWQSEEWLEFHEAELAEVVNLLVRKSPIPLVSGTIDSRGVSNEWPLQIEVWSRVNAALLARSLKSFRSENPERVIESLQAARSLIGALGDGRLFIYKSEANMARRQIYETIRYMLERSEGDNHILLEWIVLDPPLVDYRGTMLLERLQCFAALQAAARAWGKTSAGYIDIDSMHRLTGMTVDAWCSQTGGTRESARAVAPQQVLALLDDYLNEVSQWHGHPVGKIKSRARVLRSLINADPAFPVIRNLLPPYQGAYLEYGEVQSQRLALLLAAEVVRFHKQNGRWPDALDELDLSNRQASVIDPYIGLPFGYRVEGGLPLLYSLNEDEEDDGGQPGNWGEPGTDVILFRPVNACRP